MESLSRRRYSTNSPAVRNRFVKDVATVMVSYSAWNGLRMHANKELVTGFLKIKLKFREFIDEINSQIKKNLIPMRRINDAVKRILRVKFTMGLFEEPLAVKRILRALPPSLVARNTAN